MVTESWIKLILDGFTALGTVAVAVLAIWGDWFREKLAPARLEIDAGDLRGAPIRLADPPGVLIPGGRRAMWYAMKVANRRRFRTSKNCRVLLKGLSRRGPDGLYHSERFIVARQFWWAPSESTPSEVALGKEQAFDFGYIERGSAFTPTLYSVPNDFPGLVRKGESVRYSLEIDADNFNSQTPYVFEVSWDGEWHEDPERMSKHLTIREIH